MAKYTGNTRDRILRAALRELAARGSAGLTMARVADSAGVSTALLHYHYETRQRLLVAAANVLLETRQRARAVAAREHQGLAALDAIWQALVAAARDGTERARVELNSIAASDGELASRLATARSEERAMWLAAVPTLLRDLGAAPALSSEELAALVHTTVDALGTQLALGEDAVSARATFDAFWLLLVSAQGRERS